MGFLSSVASSFSGLTNSLTGQANGITSAINRTDPVARFFKTTIQRNHRQVMAAPGRAQNGTLFGSNPYSRYLANATGTTTIARRVAALRGNGQPGESSLSGSFSNAVDDMRRMRPTQAQSAATHDMETEAQIAQAGIDNATNAMYQKQADAEATRARLQNEVRIRRTRTSERPSNKGGTVLTGALGLPGTGTASRLLGA
jgi:hypothetical protein